MSLKTKFERIIQPIVWTKVFIRYDADKGNLSITGKGRHGSGQIYEYLATDAPAPGFTKLDCCRLKVMWERWHLNDMRAGTPRQEEAVRKWRPTADDPSYQGACNMFESIGLLTDGDYRYGSGWLKEEVPFDVLEWLFTLPGTGSTFSEVYSPEINQNDLDAILAVV